jgi:4-hydroxy-3-methylbut-2-enyl diphosphate reductase
VKIILAEKAGFCFGVKRAIKLALKTASKKRVYTLGPLIHNPQEVKRLKSRGIKPISALKKLEGDVLLIRSHGIDPKKILEAKRKGLKIIDATCPYVKKAQRLAKSLKEEGYRVVIIGEARHPEVLGIKAATGGRALILEDSRQAGRIPASKKIGVVAQTTQSQENFKEVVAGLLEKCEELKVYNTICDSTLARQEVAQKLAAQVDLMVVVGGYNSANTRRLAEIGRKRGVETHHLEEARELDPRWLKDKRRIGVTAGASTPDWVIKEVINKIKESEVDGRKN